MSFLVIAIRYTDNVKLLRKPWLLLPPVLAFVWTLWFFGLTHTLDRTFFDRYTVATEKSFQAPTNGVLVLIDESSLAEMGQRYSVRWPWPRSLFAALIASLHQAGAKKVLMDFEFFGSSEDSMQDDILAAYSAACPETILARSQNKTPIFWSEAFQKQYPQFGVQSRIGLVDFTPDSDGVYRHYPMPGSLAAQAASHIPDQTNSLLRWYFGLGQVSTNATISLTNMVLPAASFVVLGVQLQNELREKKYDETDPTSVARGLAALPPLDNSQVRGKVVFVGANASGTMDLKATPVGNIEPGVLVNYTAWANAEQNCFIRPFSHRGNLFISMMLACAVIFAGWRHLSAVWLAGMTAFLVVLILAESYLMFRGGVFFAPMTAVFGIFFATLASSVHNFWRESARKREIQGIFGSYISKEVVEKLLRDPDAIKLGGEKKELTVFFSDLAGFTDLSEKISPEELVDVVNRYLAAMTDFILDNGGYVDKYIGDAVMGVFGSPEPLKNHAVAACRAAIACRDWMETAFRDAPVKLHARIGLNTGPMIVGNVGSERKKNFTVLGDAVNLASRLEAANKDVGTILLIGEETERMARGGFVTRPIARLRVKGKLHPNQVHELICETGDATDEESNFVTAYTAGYTHYLKREFAAARKHFLRAKAMRPDDKMTQCYLDNSVEFEHQAPASDWDGVLILKSK
jgi:adenylate cyclase